MNKRSKSGKNKIKFEKKKTAEQRKAMFSEAQTYLISIKMSAEIKESQLTVVICRHTMFRAVALFTTCIAIGMANIVPLGYGPVFAGVPWGGAVSAGPIYPIAKPMVYSGHSSNVGGYNGGSDLYKNYEANGMGSESIRDINQVNNQGMEGITGGHLITKDDEGIRDYHHQSAGNNYNHGGLGYYGGVNNYGVASKEGYGGAGTAGHKKGHKTSGFHKTYHNVESGKDSTFLDENHDEAEEKFGQHYDDQFDDRKWGVHSSGQNNGQYAHSAIHDTAARDGAKSAGIHRANYDTLGHNGYYNNRDIAFNNEQVQAIRDNHHGAANSGMTGGHHGVYHNGYMG